jgi:hypothetical protein
MAEDDGDVDMDFPALDPKEPMSKFGFAKLALVPKPQLVRRESQKKPVIDITVYVCKMAEYHNAFVKLYFRHHVGGFSTITAESENLSLRKIVNTVLEKRKIRQRRGMFGRLFCKLLQCY